LYLPDLGLPIYHAAVRRVITNFGRNIQIRASRVHTPADTDELLSILAAEPYSTFRVAGRLHSWSRILETESTLLDLRRFNSIEIADDRQTVTVGAGCRIKEVLSFLAQHGLTLPAIGLIDEQTLVGAASTGTHGSGRMCLSEYLVAVTIAHFDSATSRAKLTTISDGDTLRAARCALGLLGVITSVTVSCRDNYRIEELALKRTSLNEVLEMQQHFPLQQFYLIPWSWDFYCHHRRESAEPTSKWSRLYRWYCYLVLDVGLHCAIWLLVSSAFSSALHRFVPVFYRHVFPRFVIQNWRIVDESRKMLVMEHEMFRHIEIEIFVPDVHLKEMLCLLVEVINTFAGIEPGLRADSNARLQSIGLLEVVSNSRGVYRHHYPICVRRVLADDSLISMASAGEIPAASWYAISLISFAATSRRGGFQQFAATISHAAASLFSARCHWGKYNPLNRDHIRRLYPRLRRFQQVRRQFDPENRFANQWLSELFADD
jgi:hypothetical protein